MNALQSWGLAIALLGLALVAGYPTLYSPDIVCSGALCGTSVDPDLGARLQVIAWTGMILVVIGGSTIIWGGGRAAKGHPAAAAEA